MTTLFDTDHAVRRSAEISECGRYRWWLRREWTNWLPNGELAPVKGVCCFVMLNPSTADALQDDPTIRRCIGFAKSWGYHTLTVRNLFAFRATDPRELHSTLHENVSGAPRNDQELIAALTADLTVIAWGAAVPVNRDTVVLRLFRETFPKKPLYCLGTTKGGYPRHPLYVRADQQPVLFTTANNSGERK